MESDETVNIWRERREQDVLKEIKAVPQGNSVILGDIFTELHVEVCYSGSNQDLDDCLASCAYHDKASILSNDGDFFRYEPITWQQYGKFKFQGDKLLLCKRFVNKHKELPSPRKILVPKPDMPTENPCMVDVMSLKLYRRGVPSALVKLCGNIHAKVTPLRRALYAQLGLGSSEKVTEEWPEWDSTKEQVKWHKEEVGPDPEGITMFSETPEVLFTKFFSAEKRPNLPDLEDWEWENHMMACRSVLFEIWLVGQEDDKKGKSLLSLLLEKPETGSDTSGVTDKFQELSLSSASQELAPKSCDSYKTSGYCKFGPTCFNASGHKMCPYAKKEKCRRGQYCFYKH